MGGMKGLAVLASLFLMTAPAYRTGLHGVVTRSPTQPACAAEDPCSEPAGHVELVFVRNGSRHSVTTDSSGHYVVALAPGLYSVQIVGARFGFEPRRVTVVAGRAARVDFDVDTGIR